MNKRNIAIIAHVDFRKTTLVDEILKFSRTFRENEDTSNISMDVNPQKTLNKMQKNVK